MSLKNFGLNETGHARAAPKSLLFAHLVLFLSTGCGPNTDLSRTLAKELLEDHPVFQTEYNEVSLIRGGFEEGVKLGFWDESKKIRPEVAQSIVSVERWKLHLSHTYQLSITEVTGIAAEIVEGSAIKHIEFSWQPINVPIMGARFITSGGSGTATARLYDDGWRIVHDPALVAADTRLPIDKAQMDQLLEISNQISVAVTSELEQRAKLVTDRDARMRASLAEHGIKAEYNLSRRLFGSHGPNVAYKLMLSDSHVYFHWPKSSSGLWKTWYGNLRGIEQVSGGLKLVFACPEYRTDNRENIYSDANIQQEFLKTFNTLFTDWKSKHSGFHGTQKCNSATPNTRVSY